MSKLLYSATMSLDGFIAGVDGDMSWRSAHLGGEQPDPEVAGLVDRIGALLIGRRTFYGDDPNRGTDAEGAFGGRWQGPSIVLSHDPPRSPPGPDVRFVDDLEAAVALAKEAAGDRYVNVLGANVAARCLEAGLLDEILVLIAPTLLGDGVPLFRRPGGADVRLEPRDPARDGRTRWWFRVVR
ncbi:dihydrofolate reductase family protein [Patulibacter defluvii]|uniref:dihydrofolate reductase family protein n=1 Tax=Patulibacter defluvii TaxID=3095358 RepID=UPI002A750A92|nr:dihydrofolate reductase family protein [Patulibacter sp. DM4]